METKIQVKVTEDDIRGGKREDAKGCPIALALGRVFPGREIVVFSYEAWVCHEVNGELLRKIPLKFDAVKFVMDFDAGYEVHPFEFPIEFDGPAQAS